MINDDLLKAVMKKAELKGQFAVTEFDQGAEFENDRLLPIIEGLCQEVERLRTALKEILAGETVLNDGLIAKKALSTSALAKLGGEGE